MYNVFDPDFEILVLNYLGLPKFMIENPDFDPDFEVCSYPKS